jgi:hypothetical protein
MCRRRSRIFLLGGWLLMHPPPIKSGEHGEPIPNNGMESAPISAWWQVSAFDSAKDCEAAKERYVDRADEQIRRRGKGELTEDERKPGMRALDGAFLAAKGSARCVPADAVYPPKR